MSLTHVVGAEAGRRFQRGQGASRSEGLARGRRRQTARDRYQRFNNDGQLSTTVIDAGGRIPDRVWMRNRVPSRLGT